MLGSIPLTAAGTLRDELQTFDLDFQHRLRLNDANTFTWGLGFRDTHDVVDNAPAIAFLPAVLDQQLYSVFLQDEIRLREGLSLTVGTKVEHNDYTGYEFEPSLRIQWQAAATQTIWAAVSRAVRAPSRIDRDLYEAPTLTILKGSEDFHSEKVLAYELGWRAQASTRLTTSLATFYNNYDDVRSTAITPATILPFYFQNGVKGHTWGAEWTGALQLTDDWSLHAGYVLLQEKLRVKPGETDLTNAPQRSRRSAAAGLAAFVAGPAPPRDARPGLALGGYRAQQQRAEYRPRPGLPGPQRESVMACDRQSGTGADRREPLARPASRIRIPAGFAQRDRAQRVREAGVAPLKIARKLLLLGALAITAGLAAQPARPQTAAPTEQQLKAVFVFNFSHFVAWPQNSFATPSEPFAIGVLGGDAFAAELEEAVRDERVDTHPAGGAPVAQHRRHRGLPHPLHRPLAGRRLGTHAPATAAARPPDRLGHGRRRAAGSHH